MSLKKLFILTFCTLIIIPYSTVMANEEAKYEVIDKNQIFEIRKYSDRLAVETSRAGIDSNFRKLFNYICLLYTSPSPRDGLLSRMPSSA